MEALADFILVAGLLITVFILVQLFRTPKKNVSHRLLITIFIVLFFVSLKYYGDLRNLGVLEIIGFPVEDPARVLIGPLLLLYVKSIFSKSSNILRRHLLHFLPFILHLLFRTLPLLISVFIGKPIFSYLEPMLDQEWMGFAEGAYLVGYCLWSLLLIRRYGALMKDNFSYLGPQDIGWIKQMILGMLVVILIDIFTGFYELSFGELEWDIGFLTVLSMDILIVYLGYFGIRQSRILLPEFLLAEHGDSKQEVADGSPVIESEEHSQMKIRLDEVLQNDRPYLDENLTLGKLADCIPTTDKKLSTFLNQYLGISFYDLINQARVEAVKQRIDAGDGETFTLLAIAFDCGFSSKTSFNRIFKKETGVSPSAYRQAAGKPTHG